MPSINLLPSDLVPKKSVLKLSETLQKVTYAFLAVYFIFILTMASIFLVNFFKQKSVSERQDALVAQLKSHEQTEQRMVLARDRMGKIKDIWGSDSVEKGFEAFNKIVTFMPSGVLVGDSKIDSKGSEISVVTTSSSATTRFMSYLVSSDIYKRLVLKNFSFNPNFGYRITFEGSF